MDWISTKLGETIDTDKRTNPLHSGVDQDLDQSAFHNPE